MRRGVRQPTKFRLIIPWATISESNGEQWKVLNPEWKANKTWATVFLLPLIKGTGPAPVYNTNIQLKIPNVSSNWFWRGFPAPLPKQEWKELCCARQVGFSATWVTMKMLGICPALGILEALQQAADRSATCLHICTHSLDFSKQKKLHPPEWASDRTAVFHLDSGFPLWAQNLNWDELKQVKLGLLVTECLWKWGGGSINYHGLYSFFKYIIVFGNIIGQPNLTTYESDWG